MTTELSPYKIKSNIGVLEHWSKGVYKHMSNSTKKKLNLSVDEKLIKTSKFIALKNDTSVSELFEEYIKAIDKNPQLIKLISDTNNLPPKSKKGNSTK